MHDKSGWISVKDRLPETDDTVLVCLQRGGYELGFYSDDSWRSLYLSYFETKELDVTHWMPLPEPPEEE